MAINYSPIGWDTNKYVNPTNMNQMDNGIKAACDAIDSEVVKLSSEGAQTIVNASTGQRTALVIKSGMANQGWLGIRDGNNNVQGSFGAKTDVPYFMTAAGADKEIALVDTITKINPYADSSLTITAAPSAMMPGIYCGYAGPGTSGFPNYGMATIIRSTQGGSALELFTPYDPNYGGEHIKARIGRGISNTWSDWEELAYRSDSNIVNLPDYSVNNLTLADGSAVQFIRNASNQLTSIVFYNSDGTSNTITV